MIKPTHDKHTMKKELLFLGLDVHAKSITIATAESGSGGEVRLYGAIANILDKYTLGDVVEVTLRKMRRDNLPMPFGATRTDSERPKRRNADPAAGFLNALGISTNADGAPARKAR